MLPAAIVINHVDPNTSHEQINLSTLAIVRSLGRRKVPVILVTTTDFDGIRRSRFVKECRIAPSIHDSTEQLKHYLIELSASLEKTPVLIPAVDESAYFVGKHYEQLAAHFHIPAPDWQAMCQINNKKHQYQIAQSLNIPIPETYYPQSEQDIITLAEKLNAYPYVIKPNISFEWRVTNAKSKGKKGITVNSAAELVKQATELFSQTKEIMIQEIIGGRDDHLVTCLSFFNRDHQPDSWFIRKKFRQHPIDFGYCTMTESCQNQEVFEQTRELLEFIGYYGISGVEWKLDPNTDKYKLIEINARPVNTTGCAIAAGVDLPAIAYYSAIDQPLPSVQSWINGQRWVWFAMDIWSAREHIKLGQLSFWQWLKSLAKVRSDAIFALDDPTLSFRYYGKFTYGLVKGRLKNGS